MAQPRLRPKLNPGLSVPIAALASSKTPHWLTPRRLV